MLVALLCTWIARQITGQKKKKKMMFKITTYTLCQLASLFIFAHCLSDFACLRTMSTLTLTVQYKQWNICSTLCYDSKRILLWYYSAVLTATFCSQTIWDLFIPLFQAREMILFSGESVYASYTQVWCCLTCSFQREREQSHDGEVFYSSHKDCTLLQY